MSKWEEVVEQGQLFYVNNDVGNIAKLGDIYVSLLPMVCKLGPFKTLDEAKAAFSKKEELKKAIEQFNQTLLGVLQ